jgi:hypothetical protein
MGVFKLVNVPCLVWVQKLCTKRVSFTNRIDMQVAMMWLLFFPINRLKPISSRDFCGLGGSAREDSVLVAYDAASLGNRFPLFRRKCMPSRA